MRKNPQEESCKVLFGCEQQHHQKHGTEHRKPNALQPGLLDVLFSWFGLRIPPTVMQGNGILRLQRHKNAEALKDYSVHPAHVAVADGKVRPYTKARFCLDYEV
mgnify:CR=1 FL=1